MTDKRTIQMIVGLLGTVALAGLILGGLLAWDEKSVPDFLIGTVGTALGALGSLLARTSSSEENP